MQGLEYRGGITNAGNLYLGGLWPRLRGPFETSCGEVNAKGESCANVEAPIRALQTCTNRISEFS